MNCINNKRSVNVTAYVSYYLISGIPVTKQKSVPFFDTKDDKEINEDASVPMDVEMEDVEVEEVKGQVSHSFHILSMMIRG